MPGATLPNIGITLPALGADPDTWDDQINEALTDLDAHDHTADNGRRITVPALNILQDLPLQGNGLIDANRVAFTPRAALTTGATTVYVNTVDGELYYRNAAGQNAKITAAGQVNITGTGGIVGDYTAVGAEVAFDDSNNRYTFKRGGSPKPWARLASGEVRVYETNTTESVYVGLATPAALAASYALTLPLALPGAQSLLQLTAAGVMTPSNTVPQAVTFSGGITCPTVTGAVAFGAGITVTGPSTLNDDVTLANNKHLVLTTGGRLKRENFGASFSLDLNKLIKASGAVNSTLGTAGVVQDPSVTAYYELPPIDWEETVASFTIRGSGASAGLTLMEYDPAAGSALATVAGTVGIPFTAGVASLTPTTPAPANGKVYVLRVITSAGSNATLIGGEYLRRIV